MPSGIVFLVVQISQSFVTDLVVDFKHSDIGPTHAAVKYGYLMDFASSDCLTLRISPFILITSLEFFVELQVHCS